MIDRPIILEFTGCHAPGNPKKLTHWQVAGIAHTREEADAFVARFPESCRLDTADFHGSDEYKGYISLMGALYDATANAEHNRQVIKDYLKFRAMAKEMGIPVEYVTPFPYSYPTEAEFHAALEAQC